MFYVPAVTFPEDKNDIKSEASPGTVAEHIFAGRRHEGLLLDRMNQFIIPFFSRISPELDLYKNGFPPVHCNDVDFSGFCPVILTNNFVPLFF